ncbi:MAG TPA: tetratricopeptide repeat protein, partial [Ktedonobacterales bacterium]|nr:tetratricopeptide repeat protein [Ktedonobacterales bacterium]
GVGKSRLALEVAREASSRFDDGVFLVGLAPLRDPAGVIAVIATVLGLRETAGTPLDEQLRAHLRPLHALLLLDNFEHLVGAAPQLAALLAAAPHCTALVTSREALRIHGEHELPVVPLAVDAAAELFLDRVRASGASLGSAADARELAEAICRRVDCLPLAIELAAVRARVLPLPLLLDRLSQRLDLLSSGLRDLPDRQRTMRDAIAWSYHLLNDREQRLFRRLSVFAGGWTLEAAEAVCGDDVDVPTGGGARGDVLEALASLVEKSLVVAETDADTSPRFVMLETIREYAGDCLVEVGDEERLRRRHAEHYARLADGLTGLATNQDAQDRDLERELPNACTAMEWARDPGEMALGLRLVAGFARLWFIRGALTEAEGWLRALLEADAAAPSDRRAPAEIRVTALFGATRLALNRRDFAAAEALAREGLALAERTGDARGAANMLAELGHVAQGRGDLDTALACFERSLALARQAGDVNAEGRALSSLGNLARARNDYQQARRYLENGLAWSQERRYSWAVAGGFASLGHVAVEEGDFAGAAEQYRKSLDLYREMPNPAWLAWWAQGVVALAEAAGDHQRAVRLAGAIAGLRAAAASESPEPWAPFDRALDAARTTLGAHAYEEELAAGAQLTIQQTLALAQRILSPRGDDEA